ncbi:MAG TPA: C13 family peptidase [Rhizomicrobium sp.]|nr:C13 family peptidase [Rhizomicrobium sp.]
MIERGLRVLALLIASSWLVSAARAAESPFAHWAAIVVAGDHEASDGGSTEGFDNARRDVGRDLLKLGFSRVNMAEFSTRPRQYRSESLSRTSPNSILKVLMKLSRKADAGCLIYFSSHGEPDGLVVGDYVVSPHALAEVVDHACGTRPTVIIISACFSGAMLPPLKGSNRMILTAARRDRTSFGCGQSDRYPFFDQCVLKTWNGAQSFTDLAQKARACVVAREKAEHVSPRSEPQFWIGPQALASLPRWH